jgi:hypothetical protein
MNLGEGEVKAMCPKMMKPRMLVPLVAILISSILIVGKPVFGANAVFEAPVVFDTSLVPGSTFYINLTVADVEHLWGFEFQLLYNTTVLTATGYESYTPFTLQMPLEINDEIGYVAAASTMLYGEPVGFSTVDPVPVARIDFVVDSEGASILHFGSEFTQLASVYGNIIPFTAEDGYFSNVALPTHDIVVTGVVASPTNVATGEHVAIYATLLNQGTETETFNVTAEYDDTKIETKTVNSLASGKSTTLGFVWITNGIIPGSYTISVLASTVEGEVNTENNRFTDGTIDVMIPLQYPVASMTWQPQTPYVGENVTFDASSSYDPDGIILKYYWNFGGGTPYVEETDPFTTHIFKTAGTYVVSLEIIDNDGLHGSARAVLTVLPGFAVKLTSPLDYFWREKIKVRLSALVTQADSGRPASDVTVTLRIYDPSGNLWVSDVMVEKLVGTGIYEWESSDTIERLQLAKGVYLVHVEASRGGSPAASDILEFHIDPPADGSSGIPLFYLVLPLVASATAVAALLLRRKRFKNEKHPRTIRITTCPMI